MFETQQRPTARPVEINPVLRDLRKDNFPVALYYAELRQANEHGRPIVDLGSPHDLYPGVMDSRAYEIIQTSHDASLQRGHYTEWSSSWGEDELRDSVSSFFERWGNVEVDPKSEVMVTRGITDSFSRVVRSIDVTHLVIPSWAPHWIRSIGTLEGKEIVEVPLGLEQKTLDLRTLEERLGEHRAQAGRVLMYITHPSVPAGMFLEDRFLEAELIPYLKQRGIVLFSDSYIVATRFDGRPIRPILSYRGAKEVAVEAITLSKEHGLPGVKAGGIAGNHSVIEALAADASMRADIVSPVDQNIASRALRDLDPKVAACHIQEVLNNETLPLLESMGWQSMLPEAGISMLLKVPPGFIDKSVDDPSLLAAFSIMRRFNVGLLPVSVFGSEGSTYLRLVLQQKSGVILEILDFMRRQGFDWETDVPSEEDIEYIRERSLVLNLYKL